MAAASSDGILRAALSMLRTLHAPSTHHGRACASTSALGGDGIPSPARNPLWHPSLLLLYLCELECIVASLVNGDLNTSTTCFLLGRPKYITKEFCVPEVIHGDRQASPSPDQWEYAAEINSGMLPFCELGMGILYVISAHAASCVRARQRWKLGTLILYVGLKPCAVIIGFANAWGEKSYIASL